MGNTILLRIYESIINNFYLRSNVVNHDINTLSSHQGQEKVSLLSNALIGWHLSDGISLCMFSSAWCKPKVK